ncbi:MAG TPA: transposase [Negativicutes bacterium]|nr:transposase [Negativicutes bacterium]
MATLFKESPTTTVKVVIPLYNEILNVVSFFSKQLKFDTYENKLGRKLALKINEVIALAIFKQRNGKDTKKSLYETFHLKKKCSYKTLVVSLNRWAKLAATILFLIMKMNRKSSHIVKHIDSTDIPVCLFKNANAHGTMKGLAGFNRNAKGMYFGLKLHLCSDLKRKMLSLKFTSANVHDTKIVLPLCKDLEGIFVADAAYISKKLSQEFYQENKRILFAKPRVNMAKLMTEFQEKLYKTRMVIELNFRSLKMFYGLITSLPRSVDGYIANYIYSLLSYQII